MLKLYRKILPVLRWLLEWLAPHVAGVESLLAPRRGLLERWRKADLGENRIWFHVSSVGELEQVRPVLEILRARGFSLVLSYFSSSVPRLVKAWDFVDYADYLPLDFSAEMKELVSIVRPRLLVLNRYDIWPNHVSAARALGVPVVLVNASTPPLGWFGRFSLWARARLFVSIDAWTFVDAAAAAAWEPYVFDRVRASVAGDPRVDRALRRVEEALREGKARERLAQWRKKGFCLVAGSTWPEDEAVILAAWKKLAMPRSLVLVPHEPTEEHLQKLEKKLRAEGLSSVRYSVLGGGATGEADVLVVDQRGILAELYGLGQLAYVGGGFHRHVHSIVEPVSHGLPVAFGPRFSRSPEAVTLATTAAACALSRYGAADELADWIRKMAESTPARGRAEEPLRVFLQIHRGAGAKVAEFLEACLALPPRG